MVPYDRDMVPERPAVASSLREMDDVDPCGEADGEQEDDLERNLVLIVEDGKTTNQLIFLRQFNYK